MTINKKVAGVAVGGVVAAALGIGVSGMARAADGTPTPSPTTTSQAPGDSGNGNGWGPGGRHGMGGPGHPGRGLGMGMGADLSQLAQKLGVDETKLRDALKAVRDDLKADRKAQADNGNAARPDAAARLDDLATRLGKELGVSADKVKTAITQLRAAEQAEHEQAFSDRLDQAVKDGKLTQAEADAVKKAAAAGIIGMGGPGRG